MTVHLLTVSAEDSVRDVEKLARKLAMTGGYEVCLAPCLTHEGVEKLTATWSKELGKYASGTKAQQVSLAGRMLKLLLTDSSVEREQRERIIALLEREGFGTCEEIHG